MVGDGVGDGVIKLCSDAVTGFRNTVPGFTENVSGDPLGDDCFVKFFNHFSYAFKASVESNLSSIFN